MENEVIEKIISELKIKRKTVEEKPDEFSKKELKLVFVDVLDSLIFMYEIMRDLPKELMKYIEEKSENFYKTTKELREKLDDDCLLYS